MTEDRGPTSEALDVLRASVRHGLDSHYEPVALHRSDASTILHLASRDRVTGFLASAVVAGEVVLDDEDLSLDIQEQWHRELALTVLLEGLIVRTARLLDAEQVKWRLTKGAALGHLDYQDPSIRTFGDVDIVVHPEDWLRGVDLLLAHGLTREIAPLRGDYDRRYGKGATLMTSESLEIDLHRRFAIGRFGVTSRMEDLFDSEDSVALGGDRIPALDAVGRLMHACYHASLGGFRRLRAFRDVAQLILVTGADWDAVLRLARSWRAEAVVVSAIVETWDRLGLEFDHPAFLAARSVEVSRSDRRALRAFQTRPTFRRKALTSLGRIPIIDTPRYVWSLAAPRDDRRSH